MIKFIQAFAVGIFCTMIADFFLFMGIQLHYLDHYHLKVYYNTLFLQHQNSIIYTLLSLGIAYLLFYCKNRKIKITLLSFLGLLCIFVLIPPVARELGKALFYKQNVALHVRNYTYHGDIYYQDKQKTYFFDTNSKEMLQFHTQNIIKVTKG